MWLASLEPFLSHGIWPFVVLVAAYVLPRFVVAVLALFKIPADKLPEVLRALAELFRFRHGGGAP